jgi:hypothetical protein
MQLHYHGRERFILFLPRDFAYFVDLISQSVALSEHFGRWVCPDCGRELVLLGLPFAPLMPAKGHICPVNENEK